MSAEPQSWRGPHHRTPNEEFVKLCDLAELVGASVELDVSAVPFGSPGHEYRNFVAIHIRAADPELERPRVTERLYLVDTMATAARRARLKLEGQLS